jgi:hypothetical protein
MLRFGILVANSAESRYLQPVTNTECHNQVHYADCRYAECHNFVILVVFSVECQYMQAFKCHYQVYFAECQNYIYKAVLGYNGLY